MSKKGLEKYFHKNTTSIDFTEFPHIIVDGIINISPYKFIIKLICSGNSITEIKNISGCKYLTMVLCNNNRINLLPEFPENLRFLNCSHNPIVNFGCLPKKLETLICSYCNLIELTNLPDSLTKIICSHNQIININNLPIGLIELDIASNKLVEISNLPMKLKILNCANNQIKYFDYLPESIIQLDCSGNPTIISVENLPNSIEIIKCPIKKNILANIGAQDIDPTKWTSKKNMIIKKNVMDNQITTFSPTSNNFIFDQEDDCVCLCNGFNGYKYHCGKANCENLIFM